MAEPPTSASSGLPAAAGGPVAEATPGRSRPALRFGAVAALAVAAALVTWALVADGDDEQAAAPTPPAVSAPARIVPAAELASTAAARDTPMFWAGPRAGSSYELTGAPGGQVFVRYLPAGVAAGDPRADFVAVATYPQTDGFAQIEAASRRPGATTLRLADGSLAVFDNARPMSVFLSSPGAAYQVEVFSPRPGEARELVESGQVVPVGSAGGSPARLVSPAQLRQAAGTLETPLFWAGARRGARYELTTTAEGRAFVRYLPAGVAAEDPRADFLTVGTYAQPGGFEQVQEAAKRDGAATIELPGGGLAVYDRARPTSVYFSSPGADYQVEVYSPRPGQARGLVESGAVRPVA